MKILVIGGYGNFGKRLVKSLLEYSHHKITIAGRSKHMATQTALQLSLEFNKKVKCATLDILSDRLNATILKLNPEIVVNASGPYHYQSESKPDRLSPTKTSNYQVARACLNANCHYIDLADHRGFVSNFSTSLNKQAKQKDLIFVTGASTVPSLTDAVIQHYLPQFLKLSSINYGISPGNRTERGNGTVASILSYTGKPFTSLIEGEFQSIWGWQNLSRYNFGEPIGKRWMSNCDIPDLELLPKKYPSLKSVEFQAGLEVSILHLGLWFLSFFSRVGLVKNWSKFSKPLTYLSDLFSSLGSDSGGMFIELSGLDINNSGKTIQWQLVAEDGVGPNIPTISAELIINKISNGELNAGAFPCMGLFQLDEFFAIADRWNIYQKENHHEL